MKPEPLVRAVAAEKVYESGPLSVRALQGINLEILPGEMVAIMGPSGCGKTTLLNCFSGLDELTSGEVYVDGKSLSSMTDKQKTEYRAKRMGFIFQSYNLLPVLTAVENVELPLLIVGNPPKQARATAMMIIEQMGMKGWEQHKPSELSAGQQQRAAIARALVNSPAIVWADEPTGNLDTDTSRQIMQLLKQLNVGNRQTFVVVTHDPAVSEWANRILRMRDGRIVEDTAAK
jgi:putative ABC transport system ATP-binding protein